MTRSTPSAVLPVPPSTEEHDGLCRSAEAVRTVIDRLDLV
jgi:hypothetical protein